MYKRVEIHVQIRVASLALPLMVRLLLGGREDHTGLVPPPILEAGDGTGLLPIRERGQRGEREKRMEGALYIDARSGALPA
jgi:hypothetical protein